MKLTKTHLKNLIKEEFSKELRSSLLVEKEADWPQNNDIIKAAAAGRSLALAYGDGNSDDDAWQVWTKWIQPVSQKIVEEWKKNNPDGLKVLDAFKKAFARSVREQDRHEDDWGTDVLDWTMEENPDDPREWKMEFAKIWRMLQRIDNLRQSWEGGSLGGGQKSKAMVQAQEEKALRRSYEELKSLGISPREGPLLADIAKKLGAEKFNQGLKALRSAVQKL